MPSYKVKFDICGTSYTVNTNDPTEYMLGLAEKLNTDMQKIIDTSSNSSVVTAAVITALNYLDEETKTRQSADNMRAQIQDYLEDASKAKLAAEEARREVERLRRELSHYEKKGRPEEKKQPEPLLNVPPPASTEPQRPFVPDEKPVAPASSFKTKPMAVPLPTPPKEDTAPSQMGLDEVGKP